MLDLAIDREERIIAKSEFHRFPRGHLLRSQGLEMAKCFSGAGLLRPIGIIRIILRLFALSQPCRENMLDSWPPPERAATPTQVEKKICWAPWWQRRTTTKFET